MGVTTAILGRILTVLVMVFEFQIACALGDEPAPKSSDDGWYGAATLEADGTIVLQLRSAQPDGNVAEGTMRYPKSHPDYRQILRHTGKLEVGEWKRIPPWDEQ
jgi:hypothetical protein